MNYGSIHRDTKEARIWRLLCEHEGEWFWSAEIARECGTMNPTTYLSGVRAQVAVIEDWDLEEKQEGRRYYYRAVRVGQLELVSC